MEKVSITQVVQSSEWKSRPRSRVRSLNTKNVLVYGTLVGTLIDGLDAIRGLYSLQFDGISIPTKLCEDLIRAPATEG